MTGINLSQSTKNAEEYTKKSSFMSKGVFLAFLVIILTVSLFVGLKIATKYYLARKAQVDGQISSLQKELESEGVDRVADFQGRMKEIETNLETKKSPNDLLRQVSMSMIPGAVAESVKETSGAVEIKVLADNFLTAAKQTLAFKKLERIKNVKMTGIGKNSDGKVEITLSMQF
jgi:DNA-binding FrmR family transcriptional regulator